MNVEYNLKGLNKFIKQIDNQTPRVQGMVDKELNRSSLRVETRAKEYAAWDTGFMSLNIYSVKLGILNYEVISPAEYSIFQELGTRYMSAQPFMYPALEEEFPILMNRLRRMMR